MQNIGDAAAGPFTVTVTANDATLAEDRFEDGLAADALETRNLSPALPQADLADGVEICIAADLPADEVAEADEANNVACVTLGA